MRVTDQQRELAAARLSRGYALGLLSLETLEERLDGVNAARTSQELQPLLGDLAPTAARPMPSGRRALRVLRRTVAETLGFARVAAMELEPGLAGQSELLLGRSRSCDVVLTSPQVSRRHAVLRRNQYGWALQDLGSINGTWVRGRLVTRAVIHAGDEFWLADQRVRVPL